MDESYQDEFSELHSHWVSTKQAKERLKDDAGEWRSGRWTSEELKTLKRNVKDFMKDEGITELAEFIFNNGKGHHRNMFTYLARDIQRPVLAVYRKMIREYDVTNYVGRWSKHQEEKLLRLHSIHGNRWARIGRLLGVSGRAAQDKHRSLTRTKQKGVWSESEEKRLISALEQSCGAHYLESPSLPLTVTWENIAELVGTRNAQQCRSKWHFYLSWKEQGGTKQWNIQDDLKLLQILSSQDNNDEDDVDWNHLAEGWPSARSPFHLRSKWACLRRCVPQYRINSYQDNLDYLVEHHIPALETNIARLYVVNDDNNSDNNDTS